MTLYVCTRPSLGKGTIRACLAADELTSSPAWEYVDEAFGIEFQGPTTNETWEAWINDQANGCVPVHMPTSEDPPLYYH